MICRVVDAVAAVGSQAEISGPVSKRRVPVARDWQCLGSDAEIWVENVKPFNDLACVQMSRRGADFKAPIKFGDRDAVDGFIELRPYRDANFDLLRVELNAAVQAVPVIVSQTVQTEWFQPVNFQCQYEPILMTKEEQDDVLESEEMEDFLRNVSAMCEKVLQQNELIDIFKNDYQDLGEDDALLDQGQPTILQEFQSFTDLQNSKSKSISCISWHPTLKGIIAIACAQRSGFEDRLANGSAVRPKSALILLWSFQDPIRPQLILEAPDDVLSFQFNPVDPTIVIAGCNNGQVALWDITEYTELLKNSRTGSDEGKDKVIVTPSLKWDVLSSIESSHRSSIQDIQWFPKEFEVSYI